MGSTSALLESTTSEHKPYALHSSVHFLAWKGDSQIESGRAAASCFIIVGPEWTRCRETAKMLGDYRLVQSEPVGAYIREAN